MFLINNKKFFLFYGENEGYKNQIIDEIILNNNKIKAIKYDENEILENYENFIAKKFFLNLNKFFLRYLDNLFEILLSMGMHFFLYLEFLFCLYFL